MAHNLDEGLLFTDPRVNDQSGFKAYLAGFMPSVPAAKIGILAEQIYPPDFSGALPYTNQVGRTKLAIAEGLVNCFAFGTALAYANQTRSYQFSVFPGMHAQDIAYTFFNGESSDFLGVPILSSAAKVMQAWFADFAMRGDSAGSSVTQVPPYTAQANVLNITVSDFATVRDPSANSRCQFWLTELTS